LGKLPALSGRRLRTLIGTDARRWAQEDLQIAEEWFPLEEEAAQWFPPEQLTESAASSAMSSATAPAASEKSGKRTKRGANRVRR
jgi:hypothetical protein